jgi:hypothetical protein
LPRRTRRETATEKAKECTTESTENTEKAKAWEKEKEEGGK